MRGVQVTRVKTGRGAAPVAMAQTGFSPVGALAIPNHQHPPKLQQQQQHTALQIGAHDAVTGADELSPRGKHKYPAWTPWTCIGIVAWLALIMAFIALVLMAVVTARGYGWTNHDPQYDWDRRAIAGREAPLQVNYRTFALQPDTPPPSVVRWPPTPQTLDELDMTTLLRTELCCLVGQAEYFVCASGKGLATNMGLSYVLRAERAGGAPHLLVSVSSNDMRGAQCTFTWDALAPSSSGTASQPQIAPSASSRHAHGRHPRQ